MELEYNFFFNIILLRSCIFTRCSKFRHRSTMSLQQSLSQFVLETKASTSFSVSVPIFIYVKCSIYLQLDTIKYLKSYYTIYAASCFVTGIKSMQKKIGYAFRGKISRMCMCHHTYLTYSMYTKKINVIFHAACLTPYKRHLLLAPDKKKLNRLKIIIRLTDKQKSRIL